jgi:DNA-binding winged helix-turn-helix (wHTH) protein
VQEVWRDTFVTDDVLIRCISELRKAFGDNAGRPTLIETIPKKGYRLLVPATRVLYRDPTRDRTGKKFVDSIAILPFENTGDSADFDYLSNGLLETALCRVGFWWWPMRRTTATAST